MAEKNTNHYPGHIAPKSNRPTVPRGWPCECGNVLGVMYRNNDGIMVLDAFRIRVQVAQLKTVVTNARRVDYSMTGVIRGDVICVSCGRSVPWDALDVLFKRMLKRIMRQ